MVSSNTFPEPQPDSALYVCLYVPKSKCQKRPNGKSFCLLLKKNVDKKFNDYKGLAVYNF